MKTTSLPTILLGSLAAALATSHQSSAADIRYKTSGPWTDVEAVTGTNGWLAPGIPGAADNARANWGGNTVTLAYAAPTINNAQIGVDESGTFEINAGGVLTSNLDVLAGNNQGNPLNPQVVGTLTVNDGGIVNVGRILWVANNDSDGVINLNAGGTINVASHLWWAVTGTGTVTIAGTLNQTGGILGLGTIDAVNPGGGTCAVTIVDGGVMNLNNIHGSGTSIQPGSTLNITGTGKLTIENDHIGNVNNYINDGKIGANGVYGDTANFSVTFDAGMNKTIVTATNGAPAPAFAATLTNTGGGNFELSWPSQSGMLYNVRSSETLTGDTSTWNLVEGDIAPTLPTNTKSLTPGVGAIYYVVEEVVPPAPVLDNASFENPATAPAGFSTIGTPWVEDDPGGAGDVNTWNATTPTDFGTIPDGDNVASIYFDTAPPSTLFGIKQTLGQTFAAGTDYTVTVQVGNADTTDWAGFRVELWAGAVLLASDDDLSTTAPGFGAWITSTVSYDDATGPAATPGDPLEIRLLSRGEDVDGVGTSPSGWTVEFDNVTFSSTP